MHLITRGKAITVFIKAPQQFQLMAAAQQEKQKLESEVRQRNDEARALVASWRAQPKKAPAPEHPTTDNINSEVSQTAAVINLDESEPDVTDSDEDDLEGSEDEDDSDKGRDEAQQQDSDLTGGGTTTEKGSYLTLQN